MLKNIKNIFIFTISTALLFISINTNAAPEKDLWKYWRTHNESSKKTVNHQPWQVLLKKHIKTNKAGINLVSYGAFTDNDKNQLSDYLLDLAHTPIRQYNRAEQMAFWINLYNALTLKLVVDHYPVESIRDINLSAMALGGGPWKANLIKINGTNVSLNDIEHRILRPIWEDPRIHYALNCASLGCPNLQKVAYTSKKLETLLNKAAKEYVNNPRGAQVLANKNLVTSKIYVWYKDDFGGNDEGVIKHLNTYADAKLKQELTGITKISKSVYDWELNMFE